MYPSEQEKAVLKAAEDIMVETMARYDPSHDKFHGTFGNISTIQSRPLNIFLM